MLPRMYITPSQARLPAGAGRPPTGLRDMRCGRPTAGLRAGWSDRLPRECAHKGLFSDWQPGLHGLEVPAKSLDAGIPRSRRGRGFAARPVALGPIGGNMLSVTAEFEDVPLRDAHVLEQHPRGMGNPAGFVPFNLAGIPAIASSNRAWALPPLSNSSKCWRRESSWSGFMNFPPFHNGHGLTISKVRDAKTS